MPHFINDLLPHIKTCTNEKEKQLKLLSTLRKQGLAAVAALALAGLVGAGPVFAQTTINESEPNNTIPTADQLAGVNFLQAIGTITAGDLDVFSFAVTTPGTVLLQLQGAPSGVGTLSDPFLSLFSGTGVFIAENDDSFGSLESLIFINLPVGTYLAVAEAFSPTQTGTYLLSVATVTSPATGPGATVVGTATVAAIPEPGTIALLALGALPLAGAVVRRRRAA